MDFLIEHDPLEHAHLVTASGELDVAAAPQLSAILTMGAASSQSVVVLDMGGATFIDSTALGVVIRSADQLTGAGKRLFIVAPDGPVSWPLREAVACEHPGVAQAGHAGRPTGGGAPVRVVVADDNALLREGLARLLGDAGMEIVGRCANAQDLMLKVASYKPDVAV